MPDKSAAARPDESAAASDARQPRADARRNRARILDAAFEAFATDGLSVPVQEIARRAGVGTGTVSRHFPTKESLFVAILQSRAQRLIAEAERLGRASDPGIAFREFFALLAAEGAVNRGMAEALAGAGVDLSDTMLQPGLDVMAALHDLLTRAQQACAIRDDIDAGDVKALLTGCLTRERAVTDAHARDRVVDVICRGLSCQSAAGTPGSSS
jgi:AcrR family transcriptional regulator